MAWQCVMLLVICHKALSNAHELWLTWILISLGWDELHCALSPTVQPVLTIPCLPVLSLIHLTDHLGNHSVVLSLSLPSIKSFTPSFSKFIKCKGSCPPILFFRVVTSINILSGRCNHSGNKTECLSGFVFFCYLLLLLFLHELILSQYVVTFF